MTEWGGYRVDQQPMTGTGFDVSMTTGHPQAFEEAARQTEHERKRVDRLAEEWRFVQELDAQGGVILTRLAGLAFRRMRLLGSEDAELSLLLDIMHDVVRGETPLRDLFAKHALRDFFAQVAELPFDDDRHQPGLFDHDHAAPPDGTPAQE